MACATIRSKLTIMRIILGMTGDTGSIEGGKDIIKVALGARQVGMGTGQWETRFRVIECCRKPGRSGVASIATGAKLTFVRIILSVARITVGR
jgi:hypothetical protein